MAVEVLIIESAGDDPRLLGLADEFAEDPRCRASMVGADDKGSLLVSIWDPEAVDETASGVAALLGASATVRRLTMKDPRLS